MSELLYFSSRIMIIDLFYKRIDFFHCSYNFVAVISEVHTDKHPFTHGALKNQKFTEKRMLLVKEIRTTVDELFPDSLDEVKTISSNEAGERKGTSPVILE